MLHVLYGELCRLCMNMYGVSMIRSVMIVHKCVLEYV